MGVFTLPQKGSHTTSKKAEPQKCSCKTNADWRCCASKSCGCVKAGGVCTQACFCRGFRLVCANGGGAPEAGAAAATSPAKKKAKKDGGGAAAFNGTGHRLADDPFEKAAAPRDRSAFLARVEREAEQRRGEGQGAAHAQPAAAQLGGGADAVDLCTSTDEEGEEEAAAAPAPEPPPALPPPPAPAAGAPVEPRRPAPWTAAAAAAAAAAARAAPRPPPPAAPPRPAAPPAAPPRPVPAPRPAPSPAWWNPPQYVPPGGLAAAGGELRVREAARLRTVDGGWLGGLAAVLDTGNEGCTLLSISAAQRAGLADAAGIPVATHGRVDWLVVRGVVAGAQERVPLARVTYEIAGKQLCITAGLTAARLGCDLLVSRHDLLLFQADGFRLSVRN